MRLTLGKTVSLLVAGVVVLALANSLVAVLSSWSVGRSLYRTVNENLPSVRAAEELEIALLEQRGFVSYYLLDGNRAWLEQLERREGNFHEWLERARRTENSAQEVAILDRLEEVYTAYDRVRSEVVALQDRGATDTAKSLLTNEASALHREAYLLCESYIRENEASVNRASENARRELRWVAATVGACAVITVLLSAALLRVFYVGVALPVRAMIDEAHSFLGGKPTRDRQRDSDELRAVGVYLRNLMSDVTDARTTLERSRQQLRNAEKLAAVGKLAASVAHEIRNPLTAIKMWLFSLQKAVGGNAELDSKFQIITEEIRRLEDIVRSLLEFSRPPEVRLSAVSLCQIVDATLKLMEPRFSEWEVIVERRELAGLPPVLADGEQLRQVLINVLNNALEAAGRGGRIEVSTASEVTGDGRPTAVVRIRDNGNGMPEDVAARVFEPFFSTKDQGVGLGLAIAARIMEQHHGRLALEATNSEGSTFAMYVPVPTGEAT